MAHELDFTAGGAAFVEAGERVTAWHNHGTHILPELLAAMTPAQQAEHIMREGRLNWTVDPYSVHDETGSLLPGYSAFKRSDTNKLFGVFPSTYTILQNHEMFELLAPMIEAGMISFNTAGAIREGSDVWTLWNFNPQDEAVRDFFAEEGILPHLLIANNHDYKRLLSIMETMVRVVCANTLSAATGTFNGQRRRPGRYPKAVLLRHTKNVKTLSVDAIDALWGKMTNRYGQIVESYQALKARYLAAEEFESAVLNVLAPLPEDVENPQHERALENALGRRALVTRLYQGEGRGIDGEPTAWNAYNAVTEAVDHYRDEFKIRGDVMQALFPGGTLADKKQDVLNALSALALRV